MNNWSAIGRLTSEPEIKYTTDDRPYVRVTLAIDRGISKEDKESGKQSADFINCIFWNGSAETVGKYVKKGNKIAVVGRIQSRTYDKENGERMYTTEARINHFYFLENKQRSEMPEPEYDGFDNYEEKDPFADFGDSIEITDEDSFLE